MTEKFLSLLEPFMPESLTGKLDFLYNGSILCIGAGIVLLLISAVLFIFALRRRRNA